MIELRAVSRTYEVGGAPVRALRSATLRIGRGEHVALVGPSGSGKSTMLHIVGCLDRPDEGEYLFDGHEVGAAAEEVRAELRARKIGFVFQFFHLLPRLTAAGNVELPMLFAGVGRAERRERAHAALEAVGLAPRATHRPDQLSGGERQRVAIARATVLDPKLLLADEPTGNLDTTSGRHVLEILEQMNAAGLTLIVVTHDPAVARRARRILVLKDGRVVHRGDGAHIHEAIEILAAAENGE